MLKKKNNPDPTHCSDVIQTVQIFDLASISPWLRLVQEARGQGRTLNTEEGGTGSWTQPGEALVLWDSPLKESQMPLAGTEPRAVVPGTCGHCLRATSPARFLWELTNCLPSSIHFPRVTCMASWSKDKDHSSSEALGFKFFRFYYFFCSF